MPPEQLLLASLLQSFYGILSDLPACQLRSRLHGAQCSGPCKNQCAAKMISMKHVLLATAAAIALATSNSMLPAAAQPMSQVDTVTTALNSIPDIIFYKDAQGIYRGGNTAWAALLGKPLDQLIGKTDLDLFPEEMAKSFQAFDKAMLAGGKPTRNNEWLVYPNGKKVYFETLKTPWIGKNGQVLGVLGISRQIKP